MSENFADARDNALGFITDHCAFGTIYSTEERNENELENSYRRRS